MLNWIEWQDDYSVNNDEIDSHHKKLVQMINVLNNSSDESIIPTIINELNDYLIYHFESEEKVLEENGYPLLNEHREEHKGFVSQILKINKYEAENKLKANMIVAYLNRWLMEHILDSDKRAFLYIMEKKNVNKNN